MLTMTSDHARPRRLAAVLAGGALGLSLLGPVPAQAAVHGDYVFDKQWQTVAGHKGRGHSMALNGRGELFVMGETFGAPARVARYTSKGRRTTAFDIDLGNDSAGGMAIGPRNQLYVTEYGVYGPIHVYDRNGRPVRTYATTDDPTRSMGDLAVDGAGRAYVTDPVNNVIRAFDPEGNQVAVFGGSGSGRGQFDTPWGIALHQGRLYVSDGGNDRVQVLTTRGRFVRAWGRTGSRGPKLFTPGNIVVRKAGAFVLDSTSRVQRYTLRGKYLGNVGRGRLRDTNDLAVSNKGHLFVGGQLRSVQPGVAKYRPRRR